MILAIDTETSGLPRSGMDIADPQYPWPVSIGAVLFDWDGADHAVLSTRIRADNRSVSPEAEAVHGISTRQAAKAGIPERVALSVVCHFAAQASHIVGYNVAFDIGILHAAIVRLGQDPSKITRPGLQVVDLMHPSTPFCRLSTEAADGAYKWPTLNEALAHIRNERPSYGHHAAIRDCRAAKRLFLSLHHRGALDTGRAA